jgi:hypothetical protein
MSIKNEMEQLVREEVALARRERVPGSRACRCALCETDVVALALTLLPPLYCREESAAHAAGFIQPGKVRDAVQVAFRRVALRPKHREGAAGATRDLALVNYTWDVGAGMVGPALGRADSACSCDSCRSDTLAYALNRYPSKYGVRLAGRQSLHPTYLDFMRHELSLLITQAARVVSNSPRH